MRSAWLAITHAPAAVSFAALAQATELALRPCVP